MKKLLTSEIKLEILKLLIPLCDESEKFEKLMKEKGISSFVIIQNYQEGFCPSSDISHYEIKREAAKEIVSSYSGSVAMLSEDLAVGYRSPLLAKLEEERDERNKRNKMPLSEHASPRVSELDPCDRARTEMIIKNKKTFDKLAFDMKSKLKKQKNLESSALSEKGSSDYSLEKSDIHSCLKYFLIKHLDAIGFQEDSKMSSKFYPVFRKEMTSNIDLCCGIDNARYLDMGFYSGKIELIFHLRVKGFKRSRVEVSPFFEGKDDDKFVIIRTQNIIPYYLGSYAFFESIKELELNLIAQISLFAVAFNQIEDKLKTKLEQFWT